MSDRMDHVNMNTNMEHDKNINYGHFKRLCDDIFIHEECLKLLWNYAKGNSRYKWLKSADFKTPIDFNSGDNFFESPKNYLINYLSCLVQEEVNYEQNSESSSHHYINWPFKSPIGLKEPYRFMFSNLYDKNGNDIYIVIFTKENFEKGLTDQKKDLENSARINSFLKKISNGLDTINREWDEINKGIEDPSKKVNFCICRVFSSNYVPSNLRIQSGCKFDMDHISPYSTNMLKCSSLNLEDIEKEINGETDLIGNIYNHCKKSVNNNSSRLESIRKFIERIVNRNNNNQAISIPEITEVEFNKLLKDSIRRARINPRTVLRIGLNSQTLKENINGQNDTPCIAQYVIPIYRGYDKNTPCAGLVVKVVDIASKSANAYNNQCVIDGINNATRQIKNLTTQYPPDWKVFFEKIKEQADFIYSYVGVFANMTKVNTMIGYMYPTMCTLNMIFKDSLFYCNGDTNNWSYIPSDAKLDISDI